MNKKLIKNKIKSTTSIKKITRTMEMVSVAKMKKAMSISDAYKAFGIEAKKILSILSDQREKHTLALPKESENILIILIAGQKGLCGGYNANLLKFISRKYSHSIDRKHKVDFITIGKYADKIARKTTDTKEKDPIMLSFQEKEFTAANARIITKRIVDDFKNSRYKEVRLIYTDYDTISTSRVEDVKLFPFVNEETNLTDELEYTFEPNIYAVYEYTVRVLVQNILLGSVSRARAAEHAARMVAMKNATDNASELIGDLKIFYNKARQASITQEIAEISSGAAAFD